MARKADFDIWYEKFKPLLKRQLEPKLYEDQADEIKMYETYGEDWEIIRNTNPRKVWTLIDCDGKLYLSHGIHIVNRMHYYICENEWDDNTRDYKY